MIKGSLSFINQCSRRLFALTLFVCLGVRADNSSLPDVPFPPENPPTEAKRLLGKILFWDEQLSSDNSVACGTCHKPSAAGSDNRLARKAGFDKKLLSKDDIFGSFGVIQRDQNGNPAALQHDPQITDRAAQNYFGGLWADTNFWDGRAASEFIDPQTNTIVIHQGGALENQALGPLMSDVEMAKHGQTIEEVITKLTQAKPLTLANDYPADIAKILLPQPSYPELFATAFGDETISFKRIAFAIATYERSLVADQTPWDLAQQNIKPLSYQQNLGWQFFKNSGCEQCHQPPLFTDNKFYNIGIQGQNADAGLKQVTGNAQDVGKMKTPTLRNVGLKSSFMHTGEFHSLSEVIDAYAEVPFKSIASKMPNGEDYNFTFTEQQRRHLIRFLQQSLTDPRVANETFPFDRPTLRSESTELDNRFLNTNISMTPEKLVQITWQTEREMRGMDVEVIRSDGKRFWTAQSPFIDNQIKAGTEYQYQLILRAQRLSELDSSTVQISTPHSYLPKLLAASVFLFLLIILATQLTRRVYI